MISQPTLFFPFAAEVAVGSAFFELPYGRFHNCLDAEIHMTPEADFDPRLWLHGSSMLQVLGPRLLKQVFTLSFATSLLTPSGARPAVLGERNVTARFRSV